MQKWPLQFPFYFALCRLFHKRTAVTGSIDEWVDTARNTRKVVTVLHDSSLPQKYN